MMLKPQSLLGSFQKLSVFAWDDSIHEHGFKIITGQLSFSSFKINLVTSS